MKIQKIKKSWMIAHAHRIDAPFHLSDGIIAKKKIENSPYETTTLDDATEKIFFGNIFKRIFVSDPKLGIPYITGSDMMKTDLNTGRYLSKKLTKKKETLKIKKDWILLSCSGTIGNVIFTNDDFEGRIGTHDLIRIIPYEKKVKRGYLYAFLKSRLGYALLTQSGYGGVVKHIEPEQIKNLPIPILSEIKQQQIHSLIIEASNLRKEANEILKNAISKIESQFTFKKNEKIFEVNINSVKSGDKYTNEIRLESDFYQPSTKDIEHQIQKVSYSLLGDVCQSVEISNLRGRTFVKNGIILFTGQSLGLLKPDLSKQMSKILTRNIESNTTKDGDILITAFGTLGKTEFCFENFYTGVFASQQIARIRVDKNKIDEGYLYLFLKSRLGQAMVMKYKTGSVIEWANWNNFCSILVPIPSDKGKIFGDIARKIAKKFDSAYHSESKAINLVETEIDSWQN